MNDTKSAKNLSSTLQSFGDENLIVAIQTFLGYREKYNFELYPLNSIVFQTYVNK